MITKYKVDYESPIGVIEIAGTREAIHSILFSENQKSVNVFHAETPLVLAECYNQLDEYLKENAMNSHFLIN